MELHSLSLERNVHNEVVRIEHPGIVTSRSSAEKSLGGGSELQKCLGVVPTERLWLDLQPNSSMHQVINSSAVKTNDLVLRLRIPKIIGRKKRKPPSGLDVEINNIEDDNRFRQAECLVQKLYDNKSKIQVESVGWTREVIRFRDMQDFQYSSLQSLITQAMDTKLLSRDYSAMITFDLDLSSSGTHKPMSMVAPPSFGTQAVPYNYRYRQNPKAFITTNRAGEQITTVNARRARAQMIVLRYNDPEVPNEPGKEVPLESSLKPSQQAMLESLRAVLQERPIATRRYVLNKLGMGTRSDIQPVTKYAVYQFGSGPWKDSLVKFGVDPRLHAEYRKYQTITFQKAVPRRSNGYQTVVPVDLTSRDINDHEFDGIKVASDVKTWQFCDVIDPDLVHLIDLPARDVCEPRSYGWLQNGVLAKYRTIMRDKLDKLYDEETPNRQDYGLILGLPHTIHKNNSEQISRAAGSTSRDKELLGMFRLAANLQNEIGSAGSTIEIEEDAEEQQVEENSWFDELSVEDNPGVPRPSSGRVR